MGLCVERSLEMVVGVLGISQGRRRLRPLDPRYPKERLAFMLQDTQAPVLLTQQRLVSGLPEHQARDGVDWTATGGPSHGEAADDLIDGAAAANLAYVIFTSGSTGTPKGVAMPHRPLVNLIEWQRCQSSSGPGQRTLQFTTLSFDVAFQEIFATWCVGGTLVLISEETRSDFTGLPGVLASQNIDRLYLPFVALQQLAKVCRPSRVVSALPEGDHHRRRAVADHPCHPPDDGGNPRVYPPQPIWAEREPCCDGFLPERAA